MKGAEGSPIPSQWGLQSAASREEIRSFCLVSRGAEICGRAEWSEEMRFKISTGGCLSIDGPVSPIRRLRAPAPARLQDMISPANHHIIQAFGRQSFAHSSSWPLHDPGLLYRLPGLWREDGAKQRRSAALAWSAWTPRILLRPNVQSKRSTDTQERMTRKTQELPVICI